MMSPEAGYLLSDLADFIRRRGPPALLEQQHALSVLLVAACHDGGLDRDSCFAMLDVYFDDLERYHCIRRHGGRHLDA